MKKILGIILATLLVLTGCGSSKEESSDKVKVGVVIYDFNDNFMSYVKTAVENGFKEKGDVEVTLENGENDQSKVNDKVDNLLAKGVDVLAINLVDPSAGQVIVDKAAQKDVPVVFFNKEPDASVLTDNENVYYVGTTSAESGELQGDLIAEEYANGVIKDTNNDGKIGYVMLKGEPGHPDAEARTKFSVEVATEAGVSLNKIGEEAAFWDTAKAKNACDALIASNKADIDVIISNNDSMAIGCIAAMADANVSIPVYGVDGLPDAIDKIENGELSGTVLNDPKNQGQATVDLSYNLAKGKDALEGTDWEIDDLNAVRVPYVKITQDNTDIARDAFGK
ncbi:MAG: galactose ABC transporter substrate-binding protein [Bacilli bacterium]